MKKSVRFEYTEKNPTSGGYFESVAPRLDEYCSDCLEEQSKTRRRRRRRFREKRDCDPELQEFYDFVETLEPRYCCSKQKAKDRANRLQSCTPYGKRRPKQNESSTQEKEDISEPTPQTPLEQATAGDPNIAKLNKLKALLGYRFGKYLEYVGYCLSGLMALDELNEFLKGFMEPPEILAHDDYFKVVLDIKKREAERLAEWQKRFNNSTNDSEALPGPSAPSSDQTHSVPSSNQTPSVPSSDQTPSVPFSDQTPSVPSSDQTPSVPSFDQTPSVPSSDQTPSVPSSDQTPRVPSFDQTPRVPSFHQTPRVPSFHQTPRVPSFHQIPSVSSFHQTPSFSSFHQTPSFSSFDQTPSFSSFDQTPSVSSFDQTPSVSSFDQTPRVPSFDQIPSVSSFDQTPSVSSFDQTPSFSSFDQTPSVSFFDQTPSVSSFDQTPRVPSFDQTPSVSSFDQTPSVPSSDQTPSVPSSEETPIVDPNSYLNVCSPISDCDSDDNVGQDIENSLSHDVSDTSNYAIVQYHDAFARTYVEIPQMNHMNDVEVTEIWSSNEANSAEDDLGNVVPNVLYVSYVIDQNAYSVQESVISSTHMLHSLNYGITQASSLPNSEIIYPDTISQSWEDDLNNLDEETLKEMEAAVKQFITNILSALVKMKKSCSKRRKKAFGARKKKTVSKRLLRAVDDLNNDRNLDLQGILNFLEEYLSVAPHKTLRDFAVKRIFASLNDPLSREIFEKMQILPNQCPFYGK